MCETTRTGILIGDEERTIRYKLMTPLSSSLVGQRVTHNPQRNRLLATLAKYKFSSALEIGCNVGACIRRVKQELIPDGYCAGIDFNPESIEYAAQQEDGIEYRVLDAEDILSVYNPGDFDLIFTVGTLMHCGPNLWRSVCEKILELKPKLIVHHEPQGEEKLMREISKGRILKMAKWTSDPLPEMDDETIIYFQRVHNYKAFYEERGLEVIFDPEQKPLSQCHEVIVVLDKQALL